MSDTWQPIETAPKSRLTGDPRLELFSTKGRIRWPDCFYDEVTSKFISVVRFYNDKDQRCTKYNEVRDATHWTYSIPLPPSHFLPQKPRKYNTMTDQFKQGDRVSVTFEGEIGADGWLRNEYMSLTKAHLLSATSITLLTPAARPLEPNETVLYDITNGEVPAESGVAIAVCKDVAWVLFPKAHTGRPVTVDIGHLSRPDKTPISQPQ